MPRTHFGGAIPSDQLIEHFWSKVDKNGPIPAHRPELGPCWIWTDYRKENGYGQFYVNRKPVYAHRFICRVVYGPIQGKVVRHRCDNGAGGCVRPEHLETGTSKQNTQDMVARGRAYTGVRHWSIQHPERVPRGEANRSAKLHADQIPLIRAAYEASGGRRGIISALAREYHVSEGAIRRVVRRTGWQHVA